MSNRNRRTTDAQTADETPVPNVENVELPDGNADGSVPDVPAEPDLEKVFAELVEREKALDEREQALVEREKALSERESERTSEPVAEPEPEPEPVAEYVILKYPHSERGEIATQLMESADRLGLPRSVVRTQSSGFKVPREIAADLFPSQFGRE